MPEGHTIHRIARQFSDTFVGASLKVTSPQGRFSEGAALLNGHTAVRSQAHGKHFFLHFDHELTLNVHLGMYGAWTFGGDERFTAASSLGAPRKMGEVEVLTDPNGVVDHIPPPPRPTVRVRLESDHGWADLIGASVCRVQTPQEVSQTLASMGPDPLLGDADPEPFYRVCSRTRRAIGAVLMDQSAIAGIGNIYRAEGLFRTGMDPYLPAQEVSRDLLEQIWADQVHLLQLGVTYGRIITTEDQHRPGIAIQDAWPEHANYVYQRHGQTCRVCQTDSIVMTMMHARKLYRCTVCQPAH